MNKTIHRPSDDKHSCEANGTAAPAPFRSVDSIEGAPACEGAGERILRVVTMIVSVLTTLLAIRYLIWRCGVNAWHLWWFSGPLLVAEIFTALHVLGYQYTIWPRKSPELRLTVDVERLPIAIFIPTVNEGNAVLEPTIRGAQTARDAFVARYPKAEVSIVVCNDGFVAGSADWQATEALAKRLGVGCVTRRTPGGAKAGNVENARRELGATGDSLLVVLDADQIAEPDLLLKTVPLFGDSEIGWVQTRQFYRNQDHRVARWAEHQASLFYDLVCPGKSTMNASYICGTNVVIRTAVLDQIGGFPQESITEDFAASVRTHQSWRSLYVNEILARGLGPMDLTGYYVQQSRWARGTLGVMLSDWRAVLLPGRAGLGFAQRVQYLLSGTHYLCGVRDLIFLGSALTCLILGESPIKSVPLATIVFYLAPYILASQLLILLQVRSGSIFTGTIIGYSSFPTLVVSFFEALTSRRMRFKVTPKSESQQSEWRVVVPHVIIVAICLAAIGHALATHMAWTRIECIPLFWVVYALCMLLPTFFLARWRTGAAK